MDKTKTGHIMSGSDDLFFGALCYALKHLYDSAALRASPLVSILGLANCPDPGSELRQVLTRAVRSLQPPTDTPVDSPPWCTYEVLLYRYVQRSSQPEVAEQLGLSIRHLGREQHRALEILADHLRRQFNLSQAITVEAMPGASSPLAEAWPSSVNDNLAWLRQS
jgi:hypothetical protein